MVQLLCTFCESVSVSACVCEEAEKVCSESVAPYMSSILEALTENISGGILGMQRTLKTQMDSAFLHKNEGTQETKKVREDLFLVTLKYLCGSQNKSYSNSPNTEERSLNAAFIVSFNIGYSAPSFMKTEVKTLP